MTNRLAYISLKSKLVDVREGKYRTRALLQLKIDYGREIFPVKSKCSVF